MINPDNEMSRFYFWDIFKKGYCNKPRIVNVNKAFFKNQEAYNKILKEVLNKYLSNIDKK